MIRRFSGKLQQASLAEAIDESPILLPKHSRAFRNLPTDPIDGSPIDAPRIDEEFHVFDAVFDYYIKRSAPSPIMGPRRIHHGDHDVHHPFYGMLAKRPSKGKDV